MSYCFSEELRVVIHPPVNDVDGRVPHNGLAFQSPPLSMIEHPELACSIKDQASCPFGFRVDNCARDGHCCLSSFAKALKHLRPESVQPTSDQLRASIVQELLSNHSLPLPDHEQGLLVRAAGGIGKSCVKEEYWGTDDFLRVLGRIHGIHQVRVWEWYDGKYHFTDIDIVKNSPTHVLHVRFMGHHFDALLPIATLDHSLASSSAFVNATASATALLSPTEGKNVLSYAAALRNGLLAASAPRSSMNFSTPSSAASAASSYSGDTRLTSMRLTFAMYMCTELPFGYYDACVVDYGLHRILQFIDDISIADCITECLSNGSDQFMSKSRHKLRRRTAKRAKRRAKRCIREINLERQRARDSLINCAIAIECPVTTAFSKTSKNRKRSLRRKALSAKYRLTSLGTCDMFSLTEKSFSGSSAKLLLMTKFGDHIPVAIKLSDTSVDIFKRMSLTLEKNALVDFELFCDHRLLLSGKPFSTLRLPRISGNVVVHVLPPMRGGADTSSNPNPIQLEYTVTATDMFGSFSQSQKIFASKFYMNEARRIMAAGGDDNSSLSMTLVNSCSSAIQSVTNGASRSKDIQSSLSFAQNIDIQLPSEDVIANARSNCSTNTSETTLSKVFGSVANDPPLTEGAAYSMVTTAHMYSVKQRSLDETCYAKYISLFRSDYFRLREKDKDVAEVIADGARGVIDRSQMIMYFIYLCSERVYTKNTIKWIMGSMKRLFCVQHSISKVPDAFTVICKSIMGYLEELGAFKISARKYVLGIIEYQHIISTLLFKPPVTKIDIRDACLISMGFKTGCRASDFFGLRLRDITDVAEDIIDTEAQKQTIVDKLKTQREPVTSSDIDRIMQYLSTVDKDRVLFCALGFHNMKGTKTKDGFQHKVVISGRDVESPHLLDDLVFHLNNHLLTSFGVSLRALEAKIKSGDIDGEQRLFKTISDRSNMSRILKKRAVDAGLFSDVSEASVTFHSLRSSFYQLANAKLHELRKDSNGALTEDDIFYIGNWARNSRNPYDHYQYAGGAEVLCSSAFTSSDPTAPSHSPKRVQDVLMRCRTLRTSDQLVNHSFYLSNAPIPLVLTNDDLTKLYKNELQQICIDVLKDLITDMQCKYDDTSTNAHIQIEQKDSYGKMSTTSAAGMQLFYQICSPTDISSLLRVLDKVILKYSYYLENEHAEDIGDVFAGVVLEGNTPLSQDVVENHLPGVVKLHDKVRIASTKIIIADKMTSAVEDSGFTSSSQLRRQKDISKCLLDMLRDSIIKVLHRPVQDKMHWSPADYDRLQQFYILERDLLYVRCNSHKTDEIANEDAKASNAFQTRLANQRGKPVNKRILKNENQCTVILPDVLPNGPPIDIIKINMMRTHFVHERVALRLNNHYKVKSFSAKQVQQKLNNTSRSSPKATRALTLTETRRLMTIEAAERVRNSSSVLASDLPSQGTNANSIATSSVTPSDTASNSNKRSKASSNGRGDSYGGNDDDDDDDDENDGNRDDSPSSASDRAIEHWICLVCGYRSCKSRSVCYSCYVDAGGDIEICKRNGSTRDHFEMEEAMKKKAVVQSSRPLAAGAGLTNNDTESSLGTDVLGIRNAFELHDYKFFNQYSNERNDAAYSLRDDAILAHVIEFYISTKEDNYQIRWGDITQLLCQHFMSSTFLCEQGATQLRNHVRSAARSVEATKLTNVKNEVERFIQLVRIRVEGIHTNSLSTPSPSRRTANNEAETFTQTQAVVTTGISLSQSALQQNLATHICEEPTLTQSPERYRIDRGAEHDIDADNDDGMSIEDSTSIDRVDSVQCLEDSSDEEVDPFNLPYASQDSIRQVVNGVQVSPKKRKRPHQQVQNLEPPPLRKARYQSQESDDDAATARHYRLSDAAAPMQAINGLSLSISQDKFAAGGGSAQSLSQETLVDSQLCDDMNRKTDGDVLDRLIHSKPLSNKDAGWDETAETAERASRMYYEESIREESIRSSARTMAASSMDNRRSSVAAAPNISHVQSDTAADLDSHISSLRDEIAKKVKARDLAKARLAAEAARVEALAAVEARDLANARSAAEALAKAEAEAAAVAKAKSQAVAKAKAEAAAKAKAKQQEIASLKMQLEELQNESD